MEKSQAKKAKTGLEQVEDVESLAAKLKEAQDTIALLQKQSARLQEQNILAEAARKEEKAREEAQKNAEKARDAAAECVRNVLSTNPPPPMARKRPAFIGSTSLKCTPSTDVSRYLTMKARLEAGETDDSLLEVRDWSDDDFLLYLMQGAKQEDVDVFLDARVEDSDLKRLSGNIQESEPIVSVSEMQSATRTREHVFAPIERAIHSRKSLSRKGQIFDGDRPQLLTMKCFDGAFVWLRQTQFSAMHRIDASVEVVRTSSELSADDLSSLVTLDTCGVVADRQGTRARIPDDAYGAMIIEYKSPFAMCSCCAEMQDITLEQKSTMPRVMEYLRTRAGPGQSVTPSEVSEKDNHCVFRQTHQHMLDHLIRFGIITSFQHTVFLRLNDKGDLLVSRVFLCDDAYPLCKGLAPSESETEDVFKMSAREVLVRFIMASVGRSTFAKLPPVW